MADPPALLFSPVLSPLPAGCQAPLGPPVDLRELVQDNPRSQGGSQEALGAAWNVPSSSGVLRPIWPNGSNRPNGPALGQWAQWVQCALPRRTRGARTLSWDLIAPLAAPTEGGPKDG